jgi:1-acyl-sn-glycerol-3-phosphate acyltransferase
MTGIHPNRKEQKIYRYPRNRFVRWMLRTGIGLGVRILTRLEIRGREHIPSGGPLIVAINHFHFFDAAVLILSSPWPLEFLSDFQMPNVPLPLKLFPALYKTYDVAQGTPNLDALRASEAILGQGGVLGIFPEGRLHTPPLKHALPGAGFLALRTGAPILPVGIYSGDDWDIFGTIGREKRRMRAVCQFGKVFGPLGCENPRRPKRSEIDSAGERIMSEIARLLPEEASGSFQESTAP